MRSLLNWYDHQYFEDRKDHQFIVQLGYSIKICKLTMYKSAYWFYYPGMHLKAITAKCCSLTDLEGTRIIYKGEPLIKGKINGWGITNTPWIYIFWDQIPMKDNLYNFCRMTPLAGKPLGLPHALPEINLIELDNL